MTVFSPSDIPSSINSLEKLYVWAATVLQHLYPTTTVIESTGVAERAISAAPFFVTASDPATWRYVSRGSIKLTSTWQRTGKIWQYAEDIGNTAIPTEFKS